MASTDLSPPEPRCFSIRLPRRLWIGLGGSAMLAGALGLAIGLPIWQQHAAVRAVEGAGGKIKTSKKGPPWLRNCLGDDRMKIFDDVVEVRFDDSEVTDATLNELGALSGLKRLSTGNGTRLSDAGVKSLRKLSRLEYLFLGNPTLTDAGARHLRHLISLKDLRVPNTQLTDNAIQDIAALPHLESLSLSNTRITDAGLYRLRDLSGLKGLWIQNTEVTDRGLENLASLKSLENIRLRGTRVTDEGVQNLQHALPRLKINK